jgi:hypothetical protein
MFYLPKPADPPDPEFRETKVGGHALILEAMTGHALVIGYGDCEFLFECQCGMTMPPLSPDQLDLRRLNAWVGHRERVNGEEQPKVAHCQCGTLFGSTAPNTRDFTERWLHVVARAWERHCYRGVPR